MSCTSLTARIRPVLGDGSAGRPQWTKISSLKDVMRTDESNEGWDDLCMHYISMGCPCINLATDRLFFLNKTPPLMGSDDLSASGAPRNSSTMALCEGSIVHPSPPPWRHVPRSHGRSTAHVSRWAPAAFEIGSWSLGNSLGMFGQINAVHFAALHVLQFHLHCKWLDMVGSLDNIALSN